MEGGGGADLPRKQIESRLEPVFFIYKILRFEKTRNIFLQKAKIHFTKIFANVQKRKLSLQH